MVATVIRPTKEEISEWDLPTIQRTIDKMEAEIAEPEAYLKVLKDVRSEKGIRYFSENVPMGVTNFELEEFIFISKPKTKVEANILQDKYPTEYGYVVEENARLVSISTDNLIKVMDAHEISSVDQRVILGNVCKTMKPSIVAQPRKVA